MGKRGPKPLDAKKRKAKPTSLRFSPDLLERLKTAALENGDCHLSEEIEARLLRSFSEPDRVQEEFGGRTTSELLRVIAGKISDIEMESGRRWWEDAWTHAKCAEFIADFYDQFRPDGDVIEPTLPVGKPLPTYMHVIVARDLLQRAYNGQDRVGPKRQITANALGPKLSEHANYVTKHRAAAKTRKRIKSAGNS